MMTPSTPVATPFFAASTNTAKAATVEASARVGLSHRAPGRGGQHETRLANLAATAAAARQASRRRCPIR